MHLKKLTDHNLNNSFKQLSNQGLDTHLKQLATKERELLAEIILHIIEVDLRKLYLKFGYPSLFEYLTQHIGYSNGSAQRRIEAARLAVAVPKVVEDLQSGDLNLSQVSLLQKSIRAAETSSKNKVDQKVKAELVDLVSNKSFAESEVIVAQMLDIAPIELTKTSHQKDESVRLQVTLSKSQWEKLQKMRELLSNTIPDGSNWAEVLEYATDQVIKLKDKVQEKQKKAEGTQKTEEPQMTAMAETLNKPKKAANPGAPVRYKDSAVYSQAKISAQHRRHIPISIQRKVYQRDQCCQYLDKATGKKCGSKWHLNIDHIQPVWAKGTNEIENLRLLCAAHNQQIYRWQTNTRHRHTNFPPS